MRTGPGARGGEGDASGAIVERVRYTPYGVARHGLAGDVTGDGAVFFNDVVVLMGWLGQSMTDPASSYNPDADLDADGDVDFADLNAALANVGAGLLPEGALSGQTVDNTVGYAGCLFDPATGLYCVRHRWYDPGLGRWTSRDPAGYVDGANLYGYVGSAPVSFTDPWGLYGTPHPPANWPKPPGWTPDWRWEPGGNIPRSRPGLWVSPDGWRWSWSPGAGDTDKHPWPHWDVYRRKKEKYWVDAEGFILDKNGDRMDGLRFCARFSSFLALVLIWQETEAAGEALTTGACGKLLKELSEGNCGADPEPCYDQILLSELAGADKIALQFLEGWYEEVKPSCSESR